MNGYLGATSAGGKSAHRFEGRDTVAVLVFVARTSMCGSASAGEQGTREFGGVMPRYIFQWSTVPDAIVDSLGESLGLHTDDVRAELARRYGARPKEEFVGDTWPTLRDMWLAKDPTARTRVVEQLRDHKLGDESVDLEAEGGEDLYLRSIRNTSTLRKVVVEQFWLLGSPRPQGEPAPETAVFAESSAKAGINDAGAAADGGGVEFPLQAIVPPRPWAEFREGIRIGDEDCGPAILDGLERDLMMDDEWMHRQGRRLEWWGGPVPVRVEVAEPISCFGDPTVKVTVSVDILCNVEASDDRVLDWIAVRNMKCSVGSLAWLPGQRRVVAFLTHYAHGGSASIDRLLPGFLVLVYTEALALVDQGGLSSILGGKATPTPHPISGMRADYDEMISTTQSVIVPRGAEANAWIGEELAALPQSLNSAGMFSLGDESGVTVEFPFTSSLPSLVAAELGREPVGRTAMAQMLAVAHPEYGQGLLTLLQIPPGTTEGSATKIANDLNLAELNDSTGFPAWGAWTVRGGDDPVLTHARFMPNAYARPGLATTAMNYDYLRSQWAQEFIVPADIVEAVRAGHR